MEDVLRIELDLTHCCIETALKRRYEKEVRRCLKTGGLNDESAWRLDGMHRALNEMDFAVLRSDYPSLAGGEGSAVVLEIRTGDRIRLCLMTGLEVAAVAFHPGSPAPPGPAE